MSRPRPLPDLSPGSVFRETKGSSPLVTTDLGPQSRLPFILSFRLQSPSHRSPSKRLWVRSECPRKKTLRKRPEALSSKVLLSCPRDPSRRSRPTGLTTGQTGLSSLSSYVRKPSPTPTTVYLHRPPPRPGSPDNLGPDCSRRPLRVTLASPPIGFLNTSVRSGYWRFLGELWVTSSVLD